jgi:hypothetical protein
LAPHTRQEVQTLFEQVVNDLERLVWQYILWPTAPRNRRDTPRIQQIGAIVEVIPNVFVHSTQLMKEDGNGVDRFLKLWANIQHRTGEIEELRLLEFHTKTYPDKEIRDSSQGMEHKIEWWQDVQQELSNALTHRVEQQITVLSQIEGASALLPAPMEEMQRLLADGAVGELWLLFSETLGTLSSNSPRSRRNSGWNRNNTAGQFGTTEFGGITSGTSAAGTNSVDGQATPIVEMDQLEARVLVDLRNQVERTFDDWRQQREAAYKKRDELGLQLRKLYFALYPYMELAARQSSALDIERALDEWVRRGCPPPQGGQEEMAKLLPPGVTPDFMQTEDPEEREKTIKTSVEKAQVVSQQYERTKAHVTELSHILERLCELVGAHVPQTERDETGAATTKCLRCGARMEARAPGKNDGWIR